MIHPTNAEVFFNGVAIEGNLIFMQKSSNQRHELIVVAPGYQPFVKSFIANASRTLRINLVKPKPPTAESLARGEEIGKTTSGLLSASPVGRNDTASSVPPVEKPLVPHLAPQDSPPSSVPEPNPTPPPQDPPLAGREDKTRSIVVPPFNAL
jgi:hypothetical protein